MYDAGMTRKLNVGPLHPYLTISRPQEAASSLGMGSLWKHSQACSDLVEFQELGIDRLPSQ